MKKYIFLLILIAFILSGCAGSTQIQPPIAEQPSIIEQPASPTPEIAVETDDYDIILYENDDGQQRTFSELIRTGEFITAEQLDKLKAQALSWQSAVVGVGGVARVVAIEPYDGSDQQVFVSQAIDQWVFEEYEIIKIQTPYDAKVRIVSAFGGAGSGEFTLVYKFTTDDSEWVEVFAGYADWLCGDGTKREWPNMEWPIDDEWLQWYADIGFEF